MLKLQNDDSQWVLPSKNYSATRYSTLDQVNAAFRRHINVRGLVIVKGGDFARAGSYK